MGEHLTYQERCLVTSFVIRQISCYVNGHSARWNLNTRSEPALALTDRPF
jgi:hypothetical protein